MAAFLVQLALYAAALGAAGLAFASLIIPASADDARGRLRAAAWLGLAAPVLAALRFGLDAAALAGGWASVAEPPYLSWTWEAHAPRLALLAAGAAPLVVGGLLGWRWPAALGGLVALTSFTTIGHTIGAPAADWLRPVLAAHLIGVALWLTAPALLWPGRSREDAVLLARVKAFSRAAVGVVPVALLAGVVLAAALLDAPSALVATAYGRMILFKALAASAAFALGALNMVWVTRRLEDDPATGRAALRATLAVDAALFTAALIAIAAATTVFAPSG